MQTEFFQVRPKYEQDKRANPHRAGFVVSNRIAVKVRDLKKAGKVLSAVLNAGATTVDGPNFELDNHQLIATTEHPSKNARNRFDLGPTSGRMVLAGQNRHANLARITPNSNSK